MNLIQEEKKNSMLLLYINLIHRHTRILSDFIILMRTLDSRATKKVKK